MMIDIETAKDLLQDDTLSLRTIAFLCGANQSAFAKAFTRATGATPGDSRATVPHVWPDCHTVLEIAIPRDKLLEVSAALMRHRARCGSIGAALADLIVRGDTTCPTPPPTIPTPPATRTRKARAKRRGAR